MATGTLLVLENGWLNVSAPDFNPAAPSSNPASPQPTANSFDTQAGCHLGFHRWAVLREPIAGHMVHAYTGVYIYFDPKTISIIPLFYLSCGTFFDSFCTLFSLILPYFAFVVPVPFYFPFSLFLPLSSFFFPHFSLFFPFFPFSFKFSLLFFSPFHIFPPKCHRLILTPHI